MKERPILFQGAMVRALLDGSKTQTRRVCKQQPYPNGYHWDGHDILCHNDYLPPSAMLMDAGGKDLYTTSNLEGWESECPYGQPGDRLWVRETFGYVSPDEHQRPHAECIIEYRADLPPGCTDRPGQWPANECKGDPERPRWRPSIHMPRAASRILLDIVSVRVERLNDCSVEDALAEGIIHRTMNDPRAEYAQLWESINGAGSWAANPWVWVVEFRRLP